MANTLPQLANTSILIVDDFAGMRDMIHSMLRELQQGNKGEPAVVHHAANGKRAIAAMLGHHYNIILCDYNLGAGRNGMQLLEEARVRGLVRATDIFVMVTAENTLSRVILAAEYRPDDYITKPFNKSLLSQRLLRLFQRKENLAPITDLMYASEYLKALQMCDTLLQSEPRNPIEIMRMRAEIATNMGNYREAEKSYSAIIKRRPMPWALLGLGIVYFKQQRMEEAQHTFNRLLAENENYLESYNWMAKLAEVNGDLQRAQQLLLQANEISPFSVSRNLQLSRVAEKNGDMKTAVKALESFVYLSADSIHEDVKHNLKLANAQIACGDSDIALKNLSALRKRFKRENRSLLPLLISEHRAYLAQKNTAQMNACFAEIKESYEKGSESSIALDAHTLLDVADAFFVHGEEINATAIVKHVVENNHDQLALLEDAQAVFDKHNRAEAGNRLIETVKREVFELNNRGTALAKEGRMEESLQLFRDALKQMPENVTININAAQVILMNRHKSKGNVSLINEVSQIIRRIEEIDPTNPHLKKLGLLQQEMNS
ncbi:MAG: tetratricopeptide repeat protein [Gammaproteobacteria bacterium]|nr:tetratricopeptide repeat protein [Gammaproteobacteria bacterium]